ncbi:hypothetical protein ACSVC9_09235 [Clostridium sp. LBM24168]
MTEKEDWKKKGKIKWKSILCWIFILAVVCIGIWSLFMDISTISYKLNKPYFLSEFFNNIEDEEAESTMFQVQASVATLGIAIIALLSESYKQYYFGISVSNYIMNDRYSASKSMGILKYKNVIIMEMVLVFVNCFLVSSGFKRLPILIFAVSMSLMIFMCHSILIIFNGTRKLKDDMQEFYIGYFKNIDRKENKSRIEYILNDLDKDLKESFVGNYLLNFNDDFKFLSSLFESIIYKYDKNIMDKWCNVYSSNCILVFNKKNLEQVKKIITDIFKLYERCNNYNYKNSKIVYLKIWDNIEMDFFANVPSIIDREMISDLISLHATLYKNIIPGQENSFNHDLINFPYNINKSIYLDKNIRFYNEAFSGILRKDLFNDIILYITNLESHSVREIAFSELLNHTRVLIDSFDNDALNKTFFNDTHISGNVINSKNEYYIKYFCGILIYFYYVREKGVDKKISKFVEDVMTSNESTIRNFIDIICMYLYEDSSSFDFGYVKDLKYKLNSWKQEDKGQFIAIDDMIEKFFLFSLLYTASYINEFVDKVSLVISEEEIVFYYFYIGYNDENLNNMKESFKKFIEMFFKDKISKDKLDKKMSVLKEGLKNVYKKNEIERAENNNLEGEKLSEIKSELQDNIKFELDKITNNFNKFKPCDIRQFSINKFNESRFFIDFKLLKMRYKIESIKKDAIYNFNLEIINILKNQNLLEVRNCGMREVLGYLFDLFQQGNLNLDTIIRSRHILWEDNQAGFKEFIKNKNDILVPNLTNEIIVLDSSRLYISVKSINVDIRELNRNYIEIKLKKLKIDYQGKYLYNIVNDIYLPFEKEELIRYISSINKNIHIKVDIEYGHSGKKAGYILKTS